LLILNKTYRTITGDLVEVVAENERGTFGYIWRVYEAVVLVPRCYFQEVDRGCSFWYDSEGDPTFDSANPSGAALELGEVLEWP
jgi:hypothetical protein